MATLEIEVNDERAREAFLRRTVPESLSRLEPGTPPQWGGMRAQDMLEHLLWALELSTGRAESACFLTQEDQDRLRGYLHADMPTPRDYMNPALIDGLPALRHDSFEEARAAVLGELKSFLDTPVPGRESRVHPIFGLLSWDEWHRVHYKHMHHHLLQFGLLTAD